MATNFPGSLDSYTTKNAADTIVEGHANDPQDAIEALEAKVGTGASTPADAKVLIGTGVGTSAWDVVPTDAGGTGATAAANAASGVVVLDANSKIPVAQLGAWVDKSASYGAQQAATDGFLMAFVTTGYTNTPTNLVIKTDAANPPTIIRARDGTDSGTTSHASFVFCPVRKGDYWLVTADRTITVYWIPLGS